MNGLKVYVIVSKLIPEATGLKRYRRIEIEPAEPLPRGIDEVGLLDHDDITAELFADGDQLGGFGGADADISDPEDISAGNSSFGFADKFADLDIPADTGGGDAR